MLKKQEKEDRENAEKAEEELKELEVEEKKLRDKVYSDAEEAKSAQCLMEARDGKECQGPGNQVCKNVISQEGRQTDICLKRADAKLCESLVSQCKEYATGVCLEEEDICVKEEPICLNTKERCIQRGDPQCLEFKTECTERAGWAFDKDVWCVTPCGDHCGGGTWSNPCCKAEGGYGWEECKKNHCKKEVDKCVKYGKEPCLKWENQCDGGEKMQCVEKKRVCKTKGQQCKTMESVCERWAPEPECLQYKIIQSGLVCNDEPYKGHCVSSCAGADRIDKTIGMVLKQSIALESIGMNGDMKTAELLAILTTTDETMQNMTLHITQQQVAVSVSPPSTNETLETSTSGSGLGDGNGNGTTDIPQGSNDIPDGSLDLSEDLDLLKRTLPLQRQSLAKIAVKNKEAKPGVKIFKSFVKSVKKWTKDEKFASLGEKDIAKVLKFTKEVKNERDRVSQINNEETINVSLNSDDVSVAKVAKSTDEYLTTKIKKIKKNAQYQLLSNRMMEALEDLANTKIDIEDKEQIIDYLDKCLGYLNKLREAWGEIKDFFVNVREMGRTVKTRAGMLKEHIDTLTSYEVSHVKIIMDDIEKDSVQAFSKNLYIIEVSSFYRNIMQKGGLLKKIRALNFKRCSEENCVQNMQQFILDDAKVTGRSISKQIG